MLNFLLALYLWSIVSMIIMQEVPRHILNPIDRLTNTDTVDIYYNGAVLDYNLKSTRYITIAADMNVHSISSTNELSATIFEEFDVPEHHRYVAYEPSFCSAKDQCDRRFGTWSGFGDDEVIEDNLTGRFLYRTNNEKYYQLRKPEPISTISMSPMKGDADEKWQLDRHQDIEESAMFPQFSITTLDIWWRVHYVLYIDDRSWHREQETHMRLYMYASVVTKNNILLYCDRVRFITSRINLLNDDDDDDQESRTKKRGHGSVSISITQQSRLAKPQIYTVNSKVSLSRYIRGNTAERLLIDEITLLTKSKWFHAYIPLNVAIVEGNFRLLVGLKSDQHLPGGPHSNMVVMYNEQIYMDTKIQTILSNTETVLKLRYNPDCSYRCVIDLNPQKVGQLIIDCELHNRHSYSMTFTLVFSDNNTATRYTIADVFQGEFTFNYLSNGAVKIMANLSANTDTKWTFNIDQ